MGYEMKLIRNVSRAKPQKLGLALFAGCFLFSMAFLSVTKLVGFRLMMNPLQYILVAEGSSNTSQLIGSQTKVELIARKSSSTPFTASNGQVEDGVDSNLSDSSNQKAMPNMKPLCDFSNPRSDVCEMEGDIRIHGNSSSIVFINPSNGVPSQRAESWRIKPHARKGDTTALRLVVEISVKSLSNHDNSFQCSVNHTVPAIIFSTGGYMGNIFHDFTDVLIPLFITSRHYQGQVQFHISETHTWWLSKYRPLLKELSHHKIIDFNIEKRAHCYPHVTVGLTSHKEMTIDPSRSPNHYSMLDFAHLLRKSYSLERQVATKLRETKTNKKPRLLIIARKWTRSFRNANEIIHLAEGLGFEAVVAEADVSSNLANFSRIVNSCDVMVGVHGAGLTNLVFLPMNAVVIQVVPLGGLEKIAWADFGGPSLDLKLKYLQYSISEEESTLIEMYPRDDPVFKDPGSISRQGWMALRGVYLDKQHVRLDVVRFKSYLEQALQLLH